MKRVLILSLVVLTLLVFDSSAEAGRRKERRAARKGGGGGVYAGAYQRRSSGGAYPIAKASYTESHAAAATVVTAGTDLAITDIAVEENTLCLTIKNIGSAATPESRLEVAITKPPVADIEVQTVRVLPLLPNQAVKIRLGSFPTADVQVDALVDPDRSIAELSEENNTLRVKLTSATMTSEPPTLADEATWSHAGG